MFPVAVAVPPQSLRPGCARRPGSAAPAAHIPPPALAQRGDSSARSPLDPLDEVRPLLISSGGPGPLSTYC